MVVVLGLSVGSVFVLFELVASIELVERYAVVWAVVLIGLVELDVASIAVTVVSVALVSVLLMLKS